MERLFETSHRLSLLLALTLCLGAVEAFAIAALGEPRTVVQPDGQTLLLIERGDEWRSWQSTTAGLWVAQGADGYWYYVRSATAQAQVLSTVRADRPAPAFARTAPPLTSRQREIHRLHNHTSTHSAGAGALPAQTLRGAPVAGHVLVILAEFADRRGTTPVGEWRDLLAGEVANYFAAASYGEVSLTAAAETSGLADDGVVGWLEVAPVHPNTATNTGQANRDLTVAALQAADPYVRFSDYDVDGNGRVTANELAVVVVVAGFERAFNGNTPSVWGHKWSTVPQLLDGVWVGGYEGGLGGYAQFGELQGDHRATMGIFVHELGHLIWGLPDLYDIDGSSSGIGTFGVMGGGSWGQAVGDLYAGNSPVLPSAWTLHRLGWAAAADGAGTVSLVASGSQAATKHDVVARAGTADPRQYFLLQNRNLQGYDRGLARQLGGFQGGLLLLHVDDSRLNNANDARRWVDVEAADGTPLGRSRGNARDLWGEGGVFDAQSAPASRLYGGGDSGVAVTDISGPGEVMSARIAITETVLEAPGLSGSAGNRLRYQVEVPAGTASVRFELDRGTGNPDLYVRLNGRANFNDSDCVSKTPGTEELCVFSSPAPGTYHVLVHAKTGFSGVRLRAQFAGGEANLPPVAAFDAQADGLSVAFDAGAAFDPDGAITAYRWVFGDGSEGTGVTTAHTYAAAGTYPVTLTVEDEAGASASLTQSVMVQAPAVAVLLEQQGLSRSGGASLRRTIALPPLAAAARLQLATRGGSGALELYARINGRPTPTRFDCASVLPATTSQLCTLDVDESANRALVLVRGATSFAGVGLQAILATGAGPQAEFTATPVADTRTLTFDAGASQGDIVEYRWNYGDGVTEIAATPQVSHTYVADGRYDVMLQVSDASGLVDNAALPVVLGSPVERVLLSDSGFNRAADGTLRRKVVLPDEPIAEVRIRISGMGNADLYVREQRRPTLSQYDCASAGADSAESCVIDNPGSQTIHVLIATGEGFSDLTLEVAYLPAW